MPGLHSAPCHMGGWEPARAAAAADGGRAEAAGLVPMSAQQPRASRPPRRQPQHAACHPVHATAAAGSRRPSRRRSGGGPAMASHGGTPRPPPAPLTMCWPLSSCLASTLARRPSMWPRQSTTTVCRAGEAGHRAHGGWDARRGPQRRSPPLARQAGPRCCRPAEARSPLLTVPEAMLGAGHAAAGLQAPPPTMPGAHRRTCGIFARAWTSTHRSRKRPRQGAAVGFSGAPCCVHARHALVPEPGVRPAGPFKRPACCCGIL